MAPSSLCVLILVCIVRLFKENRLSLQPQSHVLWSYKVENNKYVSVSFITVQKVTFDSQTFSMGCENEQIKRIKTDSYVLKQGSPDIS